MKKSIEIPTWMHGIAERWVRFKRKSTGDLKDWFQLVFLVFIIKYNSIWGKFLFGETFVPIAPDYLTMFVFAFLGVAAAHVASKWFNRRHWKGVDDEMDLKYNEYFKGLSNKSEKISVMERPYWLYCFLYAILCLAYSLA